MIKINDEISLVGLSELRTEMPKLAKNLDVKTIIVTKRGKPVAVLEDFEKYEEKKEFIEAFEDIVLGYLAKEREESSKESDYLSEEEAAKKL